MDWSWYFHLICIVFHYSQKCFNNYKTIILDWTIAPFNYKMQVATEMDYKIAFLNMSFHGRIKELHHQNVQY